MLHKQNYTFGFYHNADYGGISLIHSIFLYENANKKALHYTEPFYVLIVH